MHLLVTRPETEAETTRRDLEAMGHGVTLAPLIEIALSAPPLDVSGAQALIVTSRNAVRALAAHPDRDRLRHVPLLVVGKGTAAAARAAGFTVALEGRGTGADLAVAIRTQCDPARGRLIHASGDVIAFDLAQALAPDGFTIERVVVYHSTAATALPQPVRDALDEGRVDAVILMSPHTATVWSRLVRAAQAEAPARRLVHLCLSHGVADAVGPLAPDKIAVARAPSWEEMLALVARLSSIPADGS